MQPAVPPPAAVEPSAAADGQAIPVLPAPHASASAKTDGFTFGSYGRVIAATDFKGRSGRDADIVAHGSRLDESNYVELTLRRDDYWQKTDTWTRLVTTLAIANPVFHYTGDFDAQIAVRNLYLEVTDVGFKGLSAWAGSRMYRGDDIYLLDWWPLDNINTLGAGVRYEIDEQTTAALQGGLSSPNSGFFNQSVERPSPLNQIGASRVPVLQRQKFIGSAKATRVMPLEDGRGIKAIAYGELHELASGQRQGAPGFFETLPSDSGYVLGAQIGAFSSERNQHVNLFLRYSHGLAAYGEFAAPVALAQDGTTAGAHELLAALAGNWERGPFGVMFAGYLRSFRDASEDLDFHDVDEGIVMARPHYFINDLFGVAVEASYQAQQRGVLSAPAAEPGSLSTPEGPHTAQLVRFGLVPFISPAGPGDFSRPQFRLIWAVTLRDDAARKLYPQDDVFSLRKTEHFFGFGAEWWFNTSN